MKKWIVHVEETLCKVVEVEAETSLDAIDKVRDKYKECEIVLSADDFVQCDITCISEQDGSYHKDMSM